MLATLIGTWLGVIAATLSGTARTTGLLSFSLFTYAAPEYWIGILLILVFAMAIPLFPAGQQITPGTTSTPGSPRPPTSPSTWCGRSPRSC